MVEQTSVAVALADGTTRYSIWKLTIRINNTMQNRNNQGYTRLDEDPFANDGQIDISDDDLPF